MQKTTMQTCQNMPMKLTAVKSLQHIHQFTGEKKKYNKNDQTKLPSNKNIKRCAAQVWQIAPAEQIT